MSFCCNNCSRTFRWKSSFARHQHRRLVCKRLNYSCRCGKLFVSKATLRKHKRLYCKNNTVIYESIESEINHQSKTLDINDEFSKDIKALDGFFNAENNVDFTASITESSPHSYENNETNTYLPNLDGILQNWLNYILQIENVYNQHAVLKSEIDNMLIRLFNNSLITLETYNELVYTANLYHRLRELISLPIPQLKKAEIISILVILFQFNKIKQDVFSAILLTL